MKNELPQSAVWGLVVVGVLLVGGLVFWMFGGGRPGMSADEAKVAEIQANAAKERSEGYARGMSNPNPTPGSSSSEFQARQKAAAGGQ